MALTKTIKTGTLRDSWFELRLTETAVDNSANTSKIKWEVYLVNRNWWYTNAVKINNVKINGTQVKGSQTFSDFYDSKDYLLASGTTSAIGHDSSTGEKTVSCSISCWLYSYGDTTGSGNFTLSKIPRYLTSLSNTVSSTGLETINMSWSCSPTGVATHYVLDGTEVNMTDKEGTSETYTISGLKPGTKYSIQTKIKRKDSGLSSTTATVPGTTKAISSLKLGKTSFTLPAPGTALTGTTYKVTNPSGATTNAYLEKGTGGNNFNWTANDLTNGSTYNFNLTADAVNKIYAAYPSAKSGAMNITCQTAGKYYNRYPVTFNFTQANCGPTGLASGKSSFKCQESISEIGRLTGSYTNGVASTYTKGNGLIILSGYSGITVTTDANPLATRASASNKKVSVAGRTAVSSTVTTTTHLTQVTNGNFSVIYTDTRDFPYTENSTGITVKTYSPVRISATNLERGVDDGGSRTVGLLSLEGTFNPLDFGAVTNTIKRVEVWIKNRKIGWNAATVEIAESMAKINEEKVNKYIFDLEEDFINSNDGTFSCSGIPLMGPTAEGSMNYKNIEFLEENNYDIRIFVYDELTNISDYNSQVTVRDDGIDSVSVLFSAVKNAGFCFGGLYDTALAGPLQARGYNDEIAIVPTAISATPSTIAADEIIYRYLTSKNQFIVPRIPLNAYLKWGNTNVLSYNGTQLNILQPTNVTGSLSVGGTTVLSTTDPGIAPNNSWPDEIYCHARLVFPTNCYNEGGAINLNNSDIIGCNNIYFNDTCQASEGLIFPNSSGGVEVLRGLDNRLYYNGNSIATVNEAHPVGSIIVTSTNSNPSASVGGGTWTLIDKEFTPYKSGANTNFSINTTNTKSASMYWSRGGHSITFSGSFKNKVDIGDTELVIGTFNFANMGIKRLGETQYFTGYSDDGSAIIEMGLIYDTGTLRTYDVVGKTNDDTHISAANDRTCRCGYTITLPGIDYMLDNYCNKFYWKRTA